MKKSERFVRTRLLRLDKGRLSDMGGHLYQKHLACHDVDTAIRRLQDAQSVYVAVDGDIVNKVAMAFRKCN